MVKNALEKIRQIGDLIYSYISYHLNEGIKKTKVYSKLEEKANSLEETINSQRETINKLNSEKTHLKKRISKLPLTYVYHDSNQEVIVVDEKGEIVDASPKISNLTGYKKEELIGQNYTTISSLEYQLKKISGKTFELSFRKKNGPRILAELEVSEKKHDKYEIKLKDLSGITMKAYNSTTGKFNGIRTTKVDLTEEISTSSDELEAMKKSPKLYEKIVGSYRDFFSSIPLYFICRGYIDKNLIWEKIIKQILDKDAKKIIIDISNITQLDEGMEPYLFLKIHTAAKEGGRKVSFVCSPNSLYYETSQKLIEQYRPDLAKNKTNIGVYNTVDEVLLGMGIKKEKKSKKK